MNEVMKYTKLSTKLQQFIKEKIGPHHRILPFRKQKSKILTGNKNKARGYIGSFICEICSLMPQIHYLPSQLHPPFSSILYLNDFVGSLHTDCWPNIRRSAIFAELEVWRQKTVNPLSLSVSSRCQ